MTWWMWRLAALLYIVGAVVYPVYRVELFNLEWKRKEGRKFTTHYWLLTLKRGPFWLLLFIWDMVRFVLPVILLSPITVIRKAKQRNYRR